MTERIHDIELEKLRFGSHQTRLEIDDARVDDLAASIRRIGLIVPLVVVGDEDNYTIVSGHHRYEALKRLRFEKVPCIIKKAKPADIKEIAIADNLFRTDLSPIEIAAAIGDLVNSEVMDIEEIASMMHRTKHWVVSQLDLLSWPEDVIAAVHGGAISVSAAQNLALIVDDTYRDYLVKNACENGATARTTAAWLQAWRAMLPPEVAVEAITNAPMSGVQPSIPQAPCLGCGQVLRTDALAQVLICPACLAMIRAAVVDR